MRSGVLGALLLTLGCFPGPIPPEVRDGEVGGVDDTLDAAATSDVLVSEVEADSAEADEDSVKVHDIEPDETDDVDVPVACPTDCSDPPACHRPGACVDGTCHFPEAIDGSACDDGERCTAIDLCASAACTGSGAPNDLANDFASYAVADGGVTLVDVEIHDDTVEVLLAFPNEPQSSQPALRIVSSSGATPLETSIADGSTRALALARFDLRGRSKSVDLVALGDDTLRGTDMAILSNGDVVISATASAEMRIGNNEMIAADANTAIAARFSSNLTLRYYHRIDARHPSSRFLLGSTSCHALVPVFANETAKITDPTGFVRSATGPESTILVMWLVAVPGCGSNATVERFIVPSVPGGEILPSRATIGPDGGVLVTLAFGGELDVRSAMQGPAIAQYVADEPAALVLSFDASGGVRFAATIADSWNILTLISQTHVAALANGSLLVGPAFGQTSIVSGDGSRIEVGGNPPLSTDLAPRSWVARLDESGIVRALYVTTAAKKDYAVIASASHGDPHGNRSLIAGVWEESAFGNSPEVIALGEGGGTFAGAVEGSRLVWGTRIVAPIDGSAWLSKTLIVRPVPGTHGAIVAGDLAVPAVIGSAVTRTFDPGPSPGVFIVRVNSADGVGCDTRP